MGTRLYDTNANTGARQHDTNAKQKVCESYPTFPKPTCHVNQTRMVRLTLKINALLHLDICTKNPNNNHQGDLNLMGKETFSLSFFCGNRVKNRQ